MGHKTNPYSLRLGLIKPWQSRWIAKKGFRELLEEDTIIRKTIKEKIAEAGIANIDIARTHNQCRVTVRAARPGLIIGRGGQGVEELKAAIEKALRKLARERPVSTLNINLTIEELRRSEISAALEAQKLAWEIEKRVPFRRAMKKALDQIMQNREILGAKIRVGGRLDGAEIARDEWLAKGKLPLQTLRADIDYGEATAYTTYGTVGVKVWIYRGEVFSNESKK
jgi:small subunit ribosomal protein S3